MAACEDSGCRTKRSLCLKFVTEASVTSSWTLGLSHSPRLQGTVLYVLPPSTTISLLHLFVLESLPEAPASVQPPFLCSRNIQTSCLTLMSPPASPTSHGGKSFVDEDQSLEEINLTRGNSRDQPDQFDHWDHRTKVINWSTVYY